MKPVCSRHREFNPGSVRRQAQPSFSSRAVVLGFHRVLKPPTMLGRRLVLQHVLKNILVLSLLCRITVKLLGPHSYMDFLFNFLVSEIFCSGPGAPSVLLLVLASPALAVPIVKVKPYSKSP